MGKRGIELLTGAAIGAGVATLLLKRQQTPLGDREVKGVGAEAEVVGRDVAKGGVGVLNLFPPACPSDPSEARHPDRPYRLLQGAQVEPEAAYWTIGPRPLPRVVQVEEVRELVETEGSPYYVPPFPTDRVALEWEIAELRYLQERRDNRSALEGIFPEPPPDSLHPIYRETRRAAVSDFIQLHSPPFGAVFNIGDNFQYLIQNINQQHLRRNIPNSADPRTMVVSTGRELARMFEIETPGNFHRHALDYLFYKRPEISPPRQARVWMALDITIYSALLAAWYYKWAASTDRYSYRQRPYEYDQNQGFRVLYDDIVDDSGRFNKCPRTRPCPSPGSPRHPAFPSGHSTFSAAASEILGYFFPEERGQWDNLANNIGTARIWAGVHWRSDHIAGQRIGRAVARRMIEQLQGDCIPRPDETLNRIPSPDELRDQATRRRNQDECDPRQDQLRTQRSDPFNDCEESLGVF